MARGEPGEQEYTPQVSPEVLPRKIIPEVRRSPLVEGFEGVAGAIEKKYTADAETYAGNGLADLRIGMTQQMEQLKQNAAPGADGYTQQVLHAFDTAAKKFDLSNPYVSRAMAPGLDHLRAQFGAEAITYEANAGIKYRGDSARDTADKLAAIASQHPEQAGDLMGQALKQIRASRLGPDVELETARYAESTINRSAVLSRIEADPYHTMQQLITPEASDVAIAGLKPNEREVLLQHADAMLHQRVADSQRLEEMQDKEERKNASSALTQMIVKSQSPEGLSMADVLKAAPLFRHEPAALSNAMALASGKSAETDARVYLPLLQRAQNGEDVSSEAMAGVGRSLSKDDAARLISLSDRGLPSRDKQALDTIDGYFKQNPLAKWDTEFGVRHEQAKNEMLDWLRENPKASVRDALTQADTVAASHSSIVAQSLISAAPAPTFLVGTRNAPNLDATIKATRDAEVAQKISHAQAVQQMALIQKWVYAFEWKTPAAAPSTKQ